MTQSDMPADRGPRPGTEDVAGRLREEAQNALLAVRGKMFEDRDAAVARLERALERLNHYLKTGEVLPDE